MSKSSKIWDPRQTIDYNNKEVKDNKMFIILQADSVPTQPKLLLSSAGLRRAMFHYVNPPKT